MVISSTSTVAESIQAVSPLFTVGSAAAGACANAASKVKCVMQRAKRMPNASPGSLARESETDVMVRNSCPDR